MNKQTVEQVNQVAPTYQVSKVRPSQQRFTHAIVHGLSCDGMRAPDHQLGNLSARSVKPPPLLGNSEWAGFLAGGNNILHMPVAIGLTWSVLLWCA